MTSAYSLTVWIGKVSDCAARIRIGASAGLTFRYVGGDGRLRGSCPVAALIAARTSCAAASMLRLRSNCTVIATTPEPLTEVSWVTPGICENWRSSGWATDDAMVTGLAPG